MILVEKTPIPKNIARKLKAKIRIHIKEASLDNIWVMETMNPQVPNPTQANAMKNPLTLITTPPINNCVAIYNIMIK